MGASQLSEGGRVPWREDFLFAQGIAEGEHQVSWEDGGVYYGEWSAGRPHGRGIFVWPTGGCWQLPGSGTGGWQACAFCSGGADMAGPPVNSSHPAEQDGQL